MKDLLFKLTSDFKLIPLEFGDVVAKESMIGKVKIECTPLAGYTYTLHKMGATGSFDKMCVSLSTCTDGLEYSMANTFLNENGKYRLQISATNGTNVIISNTVEFDIDFFIDATYTPTPAEQSEVTRLLLNYDEMYDAKENTLVAGQNITITRGATSTTISATGGGGGGSSVTMVDAEGGGVNLTVDGTTRKLAKESEIPTVPTKTSELTNDSGYITSSSVPTKTSDLNNDSGFITSSALSTYATKSYVDGEIDTVEASIPTKTSDITNDSGFITNSALSSYATKTYVDEEVADIPVVSMVGDTYYPNDQITITVDDNSKTFPTYSCMSTLYQNLAESKEDKLIAGTNITLSNANKRTTINAPTNVSAFTNDSGYLTSSSLSSYATKSYVDSGIGYVAGQKQDTLVSGTNIKTINGNSILGSGNIEIQGGGSGTTVTMADNPSGGVDLTVSGTTKTLAKYTELPTVPTNVSSFTNDSGYITSSALTNYSTKSYVDGQVKSANYVPYSLDKWLTMSSSRLVAFPSGKTIKTITASDVYDMMDEYLESNSNLYSFTKESFGYATASGDGVATDDTSLPLYKYTYKNLVNLAIDSSTDPNKDVKSPKKILITASVHGVERHGAYAIINMVDMLMDDELSVLSDNFEITFVPVVNPYGFNKYVSDNDGRFNQRNVDINRNFDHNWSGGGSNKGTSANSEKETQYLNTLLSTLNPDLIVDLHNVGAGGNWGNADTYDVNLSRAYSTCFSARIKANLKRFTTWTYNGQSAGTYIVNHIDYGTFVRRGEDLGIPSILVEMPVGIKGNTGDSDPSSDDAILYAVEGNINAIICACEQVVGSNISGNVPDGNEVSY